MSETRATSSEISLRRAAKFREYVWRYPCKTIGRLRPYGHSAKSAPESRAGNRSSHRRIKRVVDLFECAPPWLLAKHRNVGPLRHLARDLSQAKHPLERGELPVDGGIRGPLRLAGDHVGRDPIGRDVLSPRIAEEFLKMSEAGAARAHVLMLPTLRPRDQSGHP